MMKKIYPRINLLRVGKTLLIGLGVAILGVWLVLTPGGILGKADAIGYSVCHRIAERSFYIGGRQMPLCARCTGMYLGMLVSLLFQLPFGRRTGFPPLKIALPLSLLAVIFVIDGINSTLQALPPAPQLYAPSNFLRLMTGAGLGMLVPLYLVPVFNQMVWTTQDPRPAVDSWGKTFGLIGAATVAALAVYSAVPAVLWPLALLSALTVPLILGMCYGLLWMMILKTETSYDRLIHAWVPLLAGVTTAMLQIGLIDLLRFRFTGTWAGFVL
jgi:uncharacterized membrane protein